MGRVEFAFHVWKIHLIPALVFSFDTKLIYVSFLFFLSFRKVFCSVIAL